MEFNVAITIKKTILWVVKTIKSYDNNETFRLHLWGLP